MRLGSKYELNRHMEVDTGIVRYISKYNRLVLVVILYKFIILLLQPNGLQVILIITTSDISNLNENINPDYSCFLSTPYTEELKVLSLSVLQREISS